MKLLTIYEKKYLISIYLKFFGNIFIHKSLFCRLFNIFLEEISNVNYFKKTSQKISIL